MSTMPADKLDIATLAYVAGVLDLQAVIRTRLTDQGTELPMVAINGPHAEMLRYLASLTGTRTTVTRRAFLRAGCKEHCSEKHQHVQSVSGRWSVTGIKATVLLWNVRPYLRLQTDVAVEALNVGLQAPFKPGVLTKMAQLGWDIPELGEQATA